ncbi:MULTISPECIES: P-type conjugative transfer protein TrbL [Pseudomonadota]|jgi:type IV secretion system protein TrbL|uniref:P-type conjugative transfer protein TrbL n=2 Tax=Burkholderiales TaxID=80840 RepID=A0A0X8NUH2_ALCXX|nr:MULTISPECIES: P-type conjugative transfer protein TrbL [Pseudomonadota]AMG34609.1 P-type conjugative transfer protein TrbL [Achromobacter xylosoxidans]MBQ5151273.1 P-type conjugative transfer protein TrbL [Citrobacter freundii]MBU9409566.1 P-type conjugative transfer protein TrbL [Burkholderia multivorans]MBU9486567.1 P-type conjugative transfer protein TrbL [Burkholderia multivorans]MBU9516434.1 P-type conjugative transfer protein TrbL [Burkholderia multivorans]
MKALHKAALIGVTLALYSTAASAQLTNQGMLDQVVTEFATRATSWQTVVMNAAMFLFWTLGTISLVFTFGFMALRKADIGEFFAEFIRFILFFGFFLWLLRNGPAFANSIIQSLARIGEQASGVASVTPSGIVDIGFMILKQAFSNSSIWSPVDSFIGVALSLGILILLAVVAINMLLLLVSGWLLMYAGIFFLGFGGSRWTSDMAINYYKTVLGVAVQIMTMVLLVGIGNDLLSSFYARMNTGTLNFEELGVMLVFCVALLMLVNRVPPLVAGVISGTGVGNAGGIGNFGAGAAIGAAMGAASMAAGAASVAGAAVMGGATSAAGGMSAIKAAFEKAGSSAGGESGGMPMLGGGSDPGSDAGSFAQAAGFGGGSSSGAGTTTPLAQAAGFGSSSGSGASGSGGSNGQQPGKSGGGPSSKGGDEAGSKKAQQGGQQAAPGSTGPGLLASAASALGTAGRVTADAGANLMQGVGEVAKAKAASMRDAAAERIADTTGGKIAAAIRASAESDQAAAVEAVPTFGGNNLAGADSAAADPDDEVAAFANREHGKSEA